MSQYLNPVRRSIFSSRASPIASTSAYTLSGWVSRPLSQSVKASQPPPTEAASSTPLAQPAQEGPTTHYRVTLRRSAIGLPGRIGKILVSMGLTRRLRSVYLRQNAATAGAILAVKELVHVDNVRRLDNVRRSKPPVGRLSKDGGAAEFRKRHASIKKEDAIWVNAKGEVIDWGREAKKAPRGYRVVGNLLSPERDEEIRLLKEGGL